MLPLPYVMAVAFVRHVLEGSEGSPQFRAQQRNAAAIASLLQLNPLFGSLFLRLSTLLTLLFLFSEPIDTVPLSTTLQPVLDCPPSYHKMFARSALRACQSAQPMKHVSLTPKPAPVCRHQPVTDIMSASKSAATPTSLLLPPVEATTRCYTSSVAAHSPPVATTTSHRIQARRKRPRPRSREPSREVRSRRP